MSGSDDPPDPARIAADGRGATGARRPSRRRAVGLGLMMLLVLGYGLGLGTMLRGADRRRRQAAMWKESVRQQDLTAQILHGPDPIVRHRVPEGPLEGGGGSSRSGRAWVDRADLWTPEDGRRRRLILIEVRGDSEDVDLGPAVIHDYGAELNGHFVDRLARAYRANKWPFRIVRTTPASGSPGGAEGARGR